MKVILLALLVWTLMATHETAVNNLTSSDTLIHSGPKTSVSAIAFNPAANHILFEQDEGFFDHYIVYYDLENERWVDLKQIFHELTINELAYSRDVTKLYTASIDKTVKVWDIKTFQLLGTLEAPNEIIHFAESPDGNRLVTVGKETS